MKRWRIVGWSAAAALLLAPLVAMQFTDEVAWDGFDFAVAALLIGGVGGAFELALRRAPNRAFLAASALALAGAFVMTWANLAVGIIGSENHPANNMFFGVVGVALLGAVLGRFRPAGLVRAMVAAAVAQVLVAVVALAAGWGFIGPFTVFFTALWLFAAALFRKAARQQASGGGAG